MITSGPVQNCRVEASFYYWCVTGITGIVQSNSASLSEVIYQYFVRLLNLWKDMDEKCMIELAFVTWQFIHTDSVGCTY